MSLSNIEGSKNKYKVSESANVQELAVLNQLTPLLNKEFSIQSVLDQFCKIIPTAFRYPEHIVVRVLYDGAMHFNTPLEKSYGSLIKSVPDSADNELVLEVYYSHPHPDSSLNIFVPSEKAFFETLSIMLYNFMNPEVNLDSSFSGRLRELAAINKVNRILREKKPLRETFEQICLFLPAAFQHPKFVSVRISYGNREFVLADFKETEWCLSKKFTTIDNYSGELAIYYSKVFSKKDEDVFKKSERHLVERLALMIVNHLNSIRSDSELSRTEPRPPVGPVSVINSRKLLQKFLTRNNYNRDIFHDLMPFKVREILLVANLYDAYSIEKDGRFSENILGEYYQFNLSSVPRVTGVSSAEEAMEWLRSKHFDLIILMMGVDKVTQIEISITIREKYPYIPINLLLNNNNDIFRFEQNPSKLKAIDNVFGWNGDPNVFFAMVKLLEDKVNVENDTTKGMVRVILLVEDSARYYSRYLPVLYSSVMEQTRMLFDDVQTDELYKMLKLRARPKILHVTNYEEAISLFHQYKENMLCLISDVSFFHNGEIDDNAGFLLVKEVRKDLPNLPIIMQSSDSENRDHAYKLKTAFIDKNSESLVQDIKDFIALYLGFGPFVFRDKKGKILAEAETLQEFEKLLCVIPGESILYHAKRNHFYAWFMARAEVHIAKILFPYKLSDFSNAEKVRGFLKKAIEKHRSEQNKGKIIPFEEASIKNPENIITLSSGSLGGKGRGVSFINTLIHNIGFDNLLPDINVCMPRTFIIRTDAFESFVEKNKLYYLLNKRDVDELAIKNLFLKANFDPVLVSQLRTLLKTIDKPLAVRSSGLFEDSLMQPFAGIFETYLIPNSHHHEEVRLQQCLNAIRMVYASVYSKKARDYIGAINYKIEEEKMAVVIQEVVGNKHEHYFYPHISGVAQSYNYYPFSHMKPEDGVAVAAIGLGQYVVGGKKAYRFSPLHPKSEINSAEDQLKISQTDMVAVDLRKQNIDLLEGEDAGLARLPISVAEKHGVLTHTASVYDFNNKIIYPGLRRSGPRIINFANILKYNYIPLASTIHVVLDVLQEAMGCPVEIEFAVDLNKDKEYRATFYLLQIKPIIGNSEDYEISEDELNKENLLIRCSRSMGNGKLDSIEDVIFVDPATFDNLSTLEIAEEISKLNEKMNKEGRPYILIGPGRWGTRDRFIGIPVTWAQISGAKVIIETSLEGFPLDASSGSHFFHNVTSMNVGYLSLQHTSHFDLINWDILNSAEVIEKTKFCKHIRFPKPLEVKMDGKQRVAIAYTDLS